MALTHLLDFSALTRLHHATFRDAIEPAAARGELARAGISDLEIGFAARSALEWERLAQALGVFELVESTFLFVLADLFLFFQFIDRFLDIAADIPQGGAVIFEDFV